MSNLIEKSALVAEIERMIKEIPKCETDKRLQAVYGNEAFVLMNLFDFIDTLEVKEVDFGTEVYKYIDEHFNVYDDGNQTLQTKDKKSLIGMVDVENIAKHFFELGLKAQKGE